MHPISGDDRFLICPGSREPRVGNQILKEVQSIGFVGMYEIKFLNSQVLFVTVLKKCCLRLINDFTIENYNNLLCSGEYTIHFLDMSCFFYGIVLLNAHLIDPDRFDVSQRRIRNRSPEDVDRHSARSNARCCLYTVSMQPLILHLYFIRLLPATRYCQGRCAIRPSPVGQRDRLADGICQGAQSPHVPRIL